MRCEIGVCAVQIGLQRFRFGLQRVRLGAFVFQIGLQRFRFGLQRVRLGGFVFQIALQRVRLGARGVQLCLQLFGGGLLLEQLRACADVIGFALVPLILYQNQSDDRGDEQHDQYDQPNSVLAVHAKSLLLTYILIIS